MAKPKKQVAKNSQEDKALQENITETIIISEEQEQVSTPRVRRSVDDVRQEEVVTIRNKMNGAINKMAAVYAIKLVTKDADTYEILK